MNIFYLIETPKQCADKDIDKHVSKMLIEYAQLMSTAHRGILDGEQYTDLSKISRKVRDKLDNLNADNTIYLHVMSITLVLF